jgi:hypothetical protein
MIHLIQDWSLLCVAHKLPLQKINHCNEDFPAYTVMLYIRFEAFMTNKCAVIFLGVQLCQC